MVWKQYRRVDAGNLSVEDLDMRIEVENSEDSEFTFEVDIWNLEESSWRRVSQDDYCRIVLGWEDGETQSVMHGVVEKKRSRRDGRDRLFKLIGTEATDHITKQRLSKTYESFLTPDEIAQDLAGLVGLTVGDMDTVSGASPERFLVKDDKPARHWFDELVKEAEILTDYGWEWFIDGGRFYFVRKDGEKDDAIELSYDNTLLSLNEADSDAENAEGLVFESVMEPSIRRGAAVAVDTEEYEGAYRVVEYDMTSDTTTGEHNVEGKLEPIDMDYTPEHEKYNRGRVGGGGGEEMVM